MTHASRPGVFVPRPAGTPTLRLLEQTVTPNPPATNQAALLRWAADRLDADMERFFSEWPDEPRNSPYTLGRKDASSELRRLAAVSVPPPAPRADDQAALRDRIAAAIRAFDFSDYGMDDVSYALEADPDAQEWVPSLADAVLAVLPPTADRAAVIAATARACAEHLRDTYSDMWTADAARSLELHAARIERGEPTALLRRMADEAQQQNETPEAETPRVVRCSRAILSRPHEPHGWSPQPGMDPVDCPGHSFTEAPE